MTFRYYLQLSWCLLIRLGKPKHIDFKENLFKPLKQITSGTIVDSNLRPVDSQSATLTTLLLCFTQLRVWISFASLAYITCFVSVLFNFLSDILVSVRFYNKISIFYVSFCMLVLQADIVLLYRQ